MAKINYFWDPLSDNILQERDETGAVITEYTAEPGLHGNIISQNRGGVESQFHYDGQGSTLAVTDDNQNVTDTFAYTAFGEVTERTGTTEVPFQYIGQKGYYTDNLTGQILVRERPYESVRARWMVVDPIKGFRGSADSIFTFNELSQYVYSSNCPLIRIDPSGTQSFLPTPMAEQGGAIKADPDRRCWTREEWQKCKNRGEVPPGHEPKDFPKDYPGLPEGYEDPRPIWWGTEVARGKDLSDRMPDEDEVDRRTGDCVCIAPYTSVSRMRPKGKKGKWPVPGQAEVDCEVGEQALMKYSAVCKGKADDPCKGPWDPECVKKKCFEYVLYQCAMRDGVTRWVNATLPNNRPNTLATKCK